MSQASRAYEDHRESQEQEDARIDEDMRVAAARDFLLANGWTLPVDIHA